jgi:hypothetical protein
MGDSDSKHDKILNRVHLWVAVLGGVITIAIGAYNVKNLFFSKKTDADKPSASVSAGKAAEGPITQNLFRSLDQNGDGKVRESEWKGAREDFAFLDLDGNGSITAQEFSGITFESMDTNRDGSIVKLEWRKARRSFDLLDENADGKISPEEFKVRERAASSVG